MLNRGLQHDENDHDTQVNGLLTSLKTKCDPEITEITTIIKRDEAKFKKIQLIFRERLEPKPILGAIRLNRTTNTDSNNNKMSQSCCTHF